MSAIVIIPARYNSTRFPGKPLATFKGKPLIQHVYEACLGSRFAKGVIVATDSEPIFEKVLAFGGEAVMTSPEHPSGTDRVAEVATKMDYDIIVNVQGDEPLIRPEMIDDVINLLSDSRAHIGTLVKKMDNSDEIGNPNIVKVVFDKERFALYFSRSPIPYYRDLEGTFNVRLATWFKHIGIYGYRRDVLIQLSKMKPTPLEETERLEQLRALENGFRIKVKETPFETIGVDIPEDIEKVEKWLNSSL